MAKRRPGTTIESVEDEMIALAMDEARKRLINGTASSQLITTIIKEGSVKAQLEKQKLELDLELTKAKTANMASGMAVEELMNDALKAFKEYSGNGDDEDYE